MNADYPPKVKSVTHSFRIIVSLISHMNTYIPPFSFPLPLFIGDFGIKSPRGNIQLQRTFFDGERTDDRCKMSDVRCDVESQSDDSCPLVYLMIPAGLS